MKLNLQKKLAAKMAKVGKKRIKINPDLADEVKSAITKADIGGLISEGKIEVIHKHGVSRHRARKLNAQRKKGRRKGHGSRKGAQKARAPKKKGWMNKIRLQRKTLREMKGGLKKGAYRRLYSLAKGGFFRSKKHLLLYTDKNKLMKTSQTSKKSVGLTASKEIKK